MANNNLIIDDYHKFVKGLIHHKTTNMDSGESHMLLGLITEIGELADAYKKMVGYNLPLETTNVVEELGDILFYLVGFCHELGITLQELMFWNEIKLVERYPEGWSQKAAIERADKKVRLGEHK